MEDFKKKDKDRLWVTIDKDVLEKFEKHIKDDKIEKSKLVQFLIERYLEKIKKK